MIRGSSLVKVLDQVRGEGVSGAMLLNREGTLLAFSGLDDKSARMTSAIASNVWNWSDRVARNHLDDNHLLKFTIKCEDGYVSVCPVSSLLLCIQAKADVQLGSLTAKMDALAIALKDPLDRVHNIICR